MLKTLARKHRLSVPKTAACYKAKTETPYGRRVCFEASIARGSRNPLVAVRRNPVAAEQDRGHYDRQPRRPLYPHKKLIQRLPKGKLTLSKNLRLTIARRGSWPAGGTGLERDDAGVFPRRLRDELEFGQPSRDRIEHCPRFLPGDAPRQEWGPAANPMCLFGSRSMSSFLALSNIEKSRLAELRTRSTVESLGTTARGSARCLRFTPGSGHRVSGMVVPAG